MYIKDINNNTANADNSIESLKGIIASAIQPVTAHGGIPFVALEERYSVRDLENLLPVPSRKRGDIQTGDSESFIFYMNRHGAQDKSVIYADVDTEKGKLNLCGVIDDHTAKQPAWRGHLCRLEPKLSVEWKRWRGDNKRNFSQSDFAAWLEENLPDIATVEGMPTGAEMLQMALEFEANAEKRLRSKTNLQSGGVQFEFVDDETKDTRTRMRVFERFTIGIPVFYGSSSAYPIEARLKYRVKDGVVMFWYELIRPDRVFKTAVDEELAKIKDATKMPVILGNPGLDDDDED